MEGNKKNQIKELSKDRRCFGRE